VLNKHCFSPHEQKSPDMRRAFLCLHISGMAPRSFVDTVLILTNTVTGVRAGLLAMRSAGRHRCRLGNCYRQQAGSYKVMQRSQE